MKQRNHMSMRLAVRMRRVSDAVLAQSLDAGGRQGEWAKEAAHGCLSATRVVCDRILALAGGSGGAREGAL